MIIPDHNKENIIKEFNDWVEIQYAGRSFDERQDFGQFYTPPELTIRLIENFESIADKDILDPSSGCGGLLAGCVLAGADPKRVYGVEIDPDIMKVAKARLSKLGVPEENLQLANALSVSSYDFSQENQIAVQLSYLNSVFCKEALDIVVCSGWDECRKNIEQTLCNANTQGVTLQEVLSMRYSIYEHLSTLQPQAGETDIWKLFPKYDPDEAGRKKRMKEISKGCELFSVKSTKGNAGDKEFAGVLKKEKVEKPKKKPTDKPVEKTSKSKAETLKPKAESPKPKAETTKKEAPKPKNKKNMPTVDPLVEELKEKIRTEYSDEVLVEYQDGFPKERFIKVRNGILTKTLSVEEMQGTMKDLEIAFGRLKKV